jgi:hypothetical protein
MLRHLADDSDLPADEQDFYKVISAILARAATAQAASAAQEARLRLGDSRPNV